MTKKVKQATNHSSKKYKYYAIAVGRKVGVVQSWNECKKRVKHYPRAIYKSFTSRKQARDFVEKHRKSKRQVKVKKERRSSNQHLNPLYLEKAMKLSPYQSVDKADSFDIEMFLANKIDNQVSTYGYVVVDPVLSKSDKPELTYQTGSVKGLSKLEIQLIGLINFLENNLMYKDSSITLEFNNDLSVLLICLELARQVGTVGV